MRLEEPLEGVPSAPQVRLGPDFEKFNNGKRKSEGKISIVSFSSSYAYLVPNKGASSGVSATYTFFQQHFTQSWLTTDEGK